MKRVLIADDVGEQRAFYAASLVLAGFAVHEAADGGQVIDVVVARAPDVVVLDLAMPVLDGLEVCRRLKADDSTASIPIIVLTGNTLPGVREAVKRAGADAFLARPCAPATLVTVIRRHTEENAAVGSHSDRDHSASEATRKIGTLRPAQGALGDSARLGPRSGRRQSTWWLYGLAAAVVLAIGIAVGLGSMASMQRFGRLSEVVEASVDQHRRLVRGLLPLTLVGVSPRAAEDWLRQRLHFNVVLPDLKNPEVTLVGGRVSRLVNANAGAIEYRLDQHRVSLFIIGEEAYNGLALGENPKFKLVRHRGYDVIIWRHGAVGYALVSDIGVRACHVCHADDEKFEGASLESFVVRLVKRHVWL